MPAPYFWEKRRRLTDEERQRAAEQWAQLVREDAMLRAVVNGEVRSVGEDFYDEIILSCVSKTEKTAAIAIGSAMAKIDAEMCSRVGDLLIYRRLRALADAGRSRSCAPSRRRLAAHRIGASASSAPAERMRNKDLTDLGLIWYHFIMIKR